MNNDLKNEINTEIELLVNSGFYPESEIFEIIEDLFYDFEDEIDDLKNEILGKIAISMENKIKSNENNSSNGDFSSNMALNSNENRAKYLNITNWDKLNNCFNQLNKKRIITIHNAGYSLDDGIYDAFEVHNYLKDNNIDSIGFCFYTFEDIVSSINENILYLSFGAFDDSKDKFREIANIITEILDTNDLDTNSSNDYNLTDDLNSRIAINNFNWDKKFDNIDYTIEYAADLFKDNIS